jgi:Flp pilus assembly protein TadD
MADPSIRSGASPFVAGPAATTDDAPAAAPTLATPTLATPTPSQRYALGDEIARGGMGVVYRATDTALGREVAVKVLREGHAPDSGAARRFADEARIAAQMQHPAIPPVHDVGVLPNGRPFLAMKLIKGQTLERLLEARSDPSAERGRFTAVFEQVCQALAYAHSRNVIHRDLKPANVMVGAFGEVQVMDWGLAKVLVERPATNTDPGETAAASMVVSLRDSDGSFTQAGSVLGTPAFMPPEQALGAMGVVDARSDVFGLGALLAAILTGKPPFDAATAELARVKAAQGKLDDCLARLDGCGADPELVALCKRCLAAERDNRPRNAGEVAAALSAHRGAVEERLRRAERERAAAEAKAAEEIKTRRVAEEKAAEQRKRRRAQRALFAAVVALALGGGAFAWWSGVQAQAVRERQGRNAEAVAGLLDQCETALRSGDAARATLSLEAAQKRAEEGGADEWAGRLTALAADLALLRDLDAVDQFRWTPLDNKLPDAAAVAARYREALGRSGADPAAVPPEAAAARALASVVRARVTGAWDWLLREEKTAGVRAALQVVDANPYRDEVRDALRAGDREKLADLAGGPAALEQPPGFTASLGECTAIRVERRRQLLEAAVRRRPGDLGLLMTLGNTYPLNQVKSAAERLRWYQAAVAVAPNNLAVHNHLGNALWNRQDPAGAEAAYREALRLDPRYARAHYNLGNVMQARGDLAGAEAAIREALRLDPECFQAHHLLGHLLRQRHDLAGAEAAYRKALRLDPSHIPSHDNLGLTLQLKGDLEGAVTEFKEVFRLDPKNPFGPFRLARVERMRALLARLPDVLADKTEPQSPREACEFAHLCGQPFQRRYASSVRLFEKAFAANPKLAADLKAAHRSDAARYAVQAAGGEGIDPPADVAARTALRQKALAWLRADLALWQKQAAAPNAAGRSEAAAKLSAWLQESDLAGVREADPLAKLPDVERAEWEKLWADVKATLAAARKPTPPAGK